MQTQVNKSGQNKFHEIVNIYFLGLIILVLAITANFIMWELGFYSWHEVLKSDKSLNISFLNLLVLVIIYPLVLGVSVKIYKLLNFKKI